MAARLGVHDAADAIGKTAFDLPDQDAAMALHREDEAVLRVGPAPALSPRAPDRPGRHRGVGHGDAPAAASIASNATVGVIAIFRDVTEQVRAKAKIDEEVRRRDQFLAMLSHELRNPLGAVVTATAMLKAAEPQTTRMRRTVDVLERQSRQMARLLDDLLDASRVTQNKIELRRRVVDLRLIAAEAADAVRPQMRERGPGVHARSRPRTVVGAWRRHSPAADSDQSAQQRHEVHAARRPRDAAGRAATATAAAVIRVSDNGAGIPPHMLDSVFDLFVQARHTLDHADGGLGVGLTLVRALVEMHGGTVSAHSDGDGKGSEFAVRLPLTALSAAAAG